MPRVANLPCRHRLSETSDDVFLMYESFFQPLMREALLPALQQLMHDERQAQVGRVSDAKCRAGALGVPGSVQ